MLWYASGQIAELLRIDSRDIRGIDLETTGLNPKSDEIIQIAIIDGDGGVLFSSFVMPERCVSWPNAERLTGISPSDVACSPTIGKRSNEIGASLRGAKLLVGYNLRFDLAFLRASGIPVPDTPQFDVMREYAVVAQRRDRSGRLLFRSLSECARHYGVDLVAHDATSDIRATMQCFHRLMQDDGARYAVPGTLPYLIAAERFALSRLNGT